MDMNGNSLTMVRYPIRLPTTGRALPGLGVPGPSFVASV